MVGRYWAMKVAANNDDDDDDDDDYDYDYDDRGDGARRKSVGLAR